MLNIYKLIDPRSKELRYIGLTDNPKRRYYQHCMAHCKNNPQLANWLWELRENNLQPEMIVWEKTYDGEYAYRREQQLIRMYLDEGYFLLNSAKSEPIYFPKAGRIYLEYRVITK